MNDKSTIAAAPAHSATEVEAYLKGLWKEMLRVPHVNPDDDFFMLGGDSVLVIEMLVAVSAHFDREFENNKFFPKPNLRTLSTLVSDELNSAS